jgi:hypothetical protein
MDQHSVVINGKPDVRDQSAPNRMPFFSFDCQYSGFDR